MTSEYNSVTHDSIRAYFGLLGSTSPNECASKIVSCVREALTRYPGQGPIRLSKVANDFSIDPAPVFEKAVDEGELTYCAYRKRFVIKLNSRYRRAMLPISSIWGDDVAFEQLEGLGRSRFTYAHEFCHRFFFTHREGQIDRALVQVVDGVRDEMRWEVLRSIRSLEERLCNNVAGELLLPTESLAKDIGEGLVFRPGESPRDFLQLSYHIQKAYAVSFDCALVHIERLVRRGVVPCGDGFAVFLIDWSSAKGVADRTSSGRSRATYRVRCSIMPKILSNCRLRPLFPGISTENLGSELGDFLASVCRIKDSRNVPQRVCFRVRIEVQRSDRQWESAETRFTGFWIRVGPNADGRNSMRLLLWGFLDEIL